MSEYELDARRLLCPMPVIKTQQKVKELQAGDLLTVYATDPGVKHDIPAWCRIYGHEVIEVTAEGNDMIIKLLVKD